MNKAIGKGSGLTFIFFGGGGGASTMWALLRSGDRITTRHTFYDRASQLIGSLIRAPQLSRVGTVQVQPTFTKYDNTSRQTINDFVSEISQWTGSNPGKLDLFNLAVISIVPSPLLSGSRAMEGTIFQTF